MDGETQIMATHKTIQTETANNIIRQKRITESAFNTL